MLDGFLDRFWPQMSKRARRETKWRVRSIVRVLKVIGLLGASAVILPVVLIALGVFLGPKGYEGVFAAPLSVLVAWTLILIWGLRRRVSHRKLERSDVRALPDRVSTYLEQYRTVLPPRARDPLDGIFDHLETLGTQLEDLDPASPGAAKFRRLLLGDLVPLIDGYRRLPIRLRHEARGNDKSPEEQVTEGLETIERQLQRVEEGIARDGLRSLATQHRYLELKYGEED